MSGANGVNGAGGVLSKAAAEREAQRSYWTEHSVETTVEAMMLDSQAKAIDLEERPEVSCFALQNNLDGGWSTDSAQIEQASPTLVSMGCCHRRLSPNVVWLAWRLTLAITHDSDLCVVQVLGMLGSVKGKRVMELGAGIGRFTGDLGAQAKSVLALDFMQRLIEENERKHGHMGNISFRSGDACELEAEPESFEVVFTNWLLMYLGKSRVVQPYKISKRHQNRVGIDLR